MNKTRFQNLPPASFFKEAAQKTDSIFLDVRTPTEYSTFHLENALNIDIKSRDFIDEINELDKTQHYFVYCRIGVRSANACNYMAMLGFPNLYNLKGGIAALKDNTQHDS